MDTNIVTLTVPLHIYTILKVTQSLKGTKTHLAHEIICSRMNI